jgi:hypothetical protein
MGSDGLKQVEGVSFEQINDLLIQEGLLYNVGKTPFEHSVEMGENKSSYRRFSEYFRYSETDIDSEFYDYFIEQIEDKFNCKPNSNTGKIGGKSFNAYYEIIGKIDLPYINGRIFIDRGRLVEKTVLGSLESKYIKGP